MHMKRTADRLFGDNIAGRCWAPAAASSPIAAQAAAMGGNVRVGLEDSLWAGPGKLAESNAQQVRSVAPDHRGPRLERRDARRGARDLDAQGRRPGRFLTVHGTERDG